MNRRPTHADAVVGKVFATQAAENSTEGAVDLMAKLAVLIVAGLLFAGYSIREGRPQPLDNAHRAAQALGSTGEAVMPRRFSAERSAHAAHASRKPAPVQSTISNRP